MMNRDHHSLLSRDAAGTRPLCVPSAPRRKLEVGKVGNAQDCCSGSEAKRIKKERKPGE